MLVGPSWWMGALVDLHSIPPLGEKMVKKLLNHCWTVTIIEDLVPLSGPSSNVLCY